MKNKINKSLKFRNTLIRGIITVLCSFLMTSFLLTAYSDAEVLERIVAIVNDDIILLSEFQHVLQTAKDPGSPASRFKLLNNMIDNMLLLNEAKRYRTGASDKPDKIEEDNSIIIGEYIDRRIKALIHVPYEAIENYYQMNIGLYRDKDIIDVRDEIEARLVETELRTKLREFIDDLRKKAYIRIQLNEHD